MPAGDALEVSGSHKSCAVASVKHRRGIRQAPGPPTPSGLGVAKEWGAMGGTISLPLILLMPAAGPRAPQPIGIDGLADGAVTHAAADRISLAQPPRVAHVGYILWLGFVRISLYVEGGRPSRPIGPPAADAGVQRAPRRRGGQFLF